MAAGELVTLAPWVCSQCGAAFSDQSMKSAAPAAVASDDTFTRLSGRSLRYFREAGYRGGLYPINPTRDTVQGLAAYPDVAAVPGPVECAVIAVPANLAIEAMESCVQKGVKAVVMFTAARVRNRLS